MDDGSGHEVRIQDSDLDDSFQIAVIHQIESNGSERHIIVIRESGDYSYYRHVLLEIQEFDLNCGPWNRFGFSFQGFGINRVSRYTRLTRYISELN